MTYYFKNKVRQKLVQYFGLCHNKVIVCRHKSSEKRDSNRRYSKIWLSSITFIFSLIQSLVHSCKGKKRGQMGKISASKASRVMAEEVERSTVSPPQTTSRLASLANFFVRPSRFFFLFPPMRSLVPGYVQVVLGAPPSCPNWAPQLLPNCLPILFWTPATQATQGTGLLLCDESIYRIIHLQ